MIIVAFVYLGIFIIAGKNNNNITR